MNITTKKDIFDILTEKYKKPGIEVNVGDNIQISYRIFENGKDRIQNIEGVIIAKQNRDLAKNITIRRIVQGIGLEQVLFLNSPKILSIKKKHSSKVRRSKLYYLRNLSGKKARLKIKK